MFNVLNILGKVNIFIYNVRSLSFLFIKIPLRERKQVKIKRNRITKISFCVDSLSVETKNSEYV